MLAQSVPLIRFSGVMAAKISVEKEKVMPLSSFIPEVYARGEHRTQEDRGEEALSL